ncbi:MAG TPA: hypothetical protein PLL53_11650 [Saprospiraceae bacterium]|nr:hypothetical protein [Saprospiraceae bacterium]
MPNLYEEKMNRVSGNIIHKETGIGIRFAFVVEIDDVDLSNQYDNPDPDNNILAHPGIPLKDETFWNSDADSTKRQGLPADRLVSGSTNLEGYFELSYHDEAFNIRKRKGTLPNTAAEERRPDLVLTLSKPEGLNMTEFSNVVFRSNWVRINAGRDEYFRIEISNEECRKFGIPVPASPLLDERDEEPEAPDTFEKRLEARVNEKLAVKSGIKSVYGKLNEQNRQFIQERKQKFTLPFIHKISKIPTHLREDTLHFVADGESVTDKSRMNIEDRIKNFYNKKESRPKQKGIVRLSDEDVNKLELSAATSTSIELSGTKAKILEQHIKGVVEDEDTSLTDLIHQSPYSITCLENSTDTSAWDILCKETPATDPSSSGTGSLSGDIAPAKDEDIPLYIAKQMSRSVSPEDPVRFSDSNTLLQPEQRADQKIVEDSISSLSLRQGPADTPAFYDFHQVQIAFEHVWQEAIDSGVVDLADQLYDKVVEVGGEITPDNFEEAPRAGGQTRVNIRVPVGVAKLFNVSSKVWSLCSGEMRETLEDLAYDISIIDAAVNLLMQILSIADDNGFYYKDSNSKESIEIRKKIRKNLKLSDIGNIHLIPNLNVKVLNNRINNLKNEKAEALINANNLLANIQEQVDEDQYYDNIPGVKDLNAHETLQALDKKLKEPYSFKHYAANSKERSINFGILVTYRQEWTPLAYQAGELVKTIPLAPKEVKKYSKKEVVKRTRSQKEMENNLRVLKEDRSDTGRSESEIMNKVGNTSNYNSTSKGTYDVFLAKGEYETTSSGANSRNSDDTKKSFRESVLKAAQEYRNERKLEISTEYTYESEITESGEISNPNDELTVTYLFYELQRRYRISERIHRLRPVIFVAQEMPTPESIKNVFVLKNGWIIRRVLLDDSFRPALDFITTSMVGTEVGIEQLRNNLKLQRKIVDRLQEQLVVLKEEVSRRYRLFEAAVDKEAGLSGGGSSSLDFLEKVDPTGLVDGVTDFLFGGEADAERARARREAAMSAYDKAARDRDAMLSQLEREAGNLNAITERYNQKISEYLNMKTQIESLFVHIKQNILHYMQAIWSYEPSDQRFFRLYNTPVVDIQGTMKYHFFVTPNDFDVTSPPVSYNGGNSGAQKKKTYKFTAEPDMKIVTTTLEEVADLDNLLGFKGNYMIFPLKKSNMLTDYMMTPYLDGDLGLRDPDELGNLSMEEFSKYVCCLKKNLGATFDEHKEQLQKIYEKLLTAQRRQEDTITVPSGSLFIEAILGKHRLLEEFKGKHRALDVKKVQAEVRKMEMENIRLAARLLKGELEDPDVEKKVVITGDGAGTNIND